ncbi:MAG: M14 family metallopeptidase [Planctomycetota bacterium]|nr:M14 family metallopeptidase [Planctomycetota bacterium]
MAHALRTLLVLAAATFSASAQLNGLPAIKPEAAAETSKYTATSSSAQVETFCDQMPTASGLVRRLSLGKSHEGRDIPLLLIADPPVSNREEAMERLRMPDTLLVLAIGNIHAGEVDGKEALMMLSRDLAMSRKPLLQNIILAVVPNYNPDGNERLSTTNRPGQDGPSLGQGQRENALGLDLNRDGIKLDAPETRALFKFITQWDPHVFIDAHTTDGSFHRYIMTTDGPKNPAGNAAIIEYSRDHFFPALFERFRKANSAQGWDAFFYGNFEDEFGPGGLPEQPRTHTRWETFPAEPRYLTTCLGLRSLHSILTESYTYAPYKDRVQAQYSYIKCALEQLASEAPAIRTMLQKADETTAAAHPDDLPIRTRMTSAPDKITIKGFIEKIEKGRSVPTLEAQEYSVTHYNRFEGIHIVKRPLGYVLSPQCPKEVIERLTLHGIAFEQITEPKTYNLSSFTITQSKPASRPFQNRVLIRVDADVTPAAPVTVEPGSIVVSTAQPLGNLIVLMLEPCSEDGLATWGFFDAFLKADEKPFPVRRVER